MTDIIIGAGKLTLTGHAVGVLIAPPTAFYLLGTQCSRLYNQLQ